VIADIDKDKDVVLFPFPYADLGGLQREAGAYRHRDLNVWDLDDIATDSAAHNWGSTGRLIIYAHGSDEVGYRHRLYAGKDTFKSAPDVAKAIKAAGFPIGASNEIVVWSCHAGIVGGFAQLLALHLINEGYTGKRVWGCKRFGGTIDADAGCLKASDQASEVPHRATEADAQFFIGVGAPLGARSAAES
jgi:hypothetical protein